MSDKRRVSGKLGMVGLLVVGAAACGPLPEEDGLPPPGEGFDTTHIQALTAVCQLDVPAAGTGANNTVKVRGTANADTFTYGTIAGTTFLSMGFGVSATTLATARTFPDLSMTGVTDVVACGGPGNDLITGQGGPPIGGTI